MDAHGYVAEKDRHPSQFGYLLPDGDDFESGKTIHATKLANFNAYDKAVTARVSDKLGPELAEDPVVKAFTAAVESVSAEAQLDAQIADTTARGVNVQKEFEDIRKKAAPAKLNHIQLKHFSNKIYEIQLKHTATEYIPNAVPNKAVVAAATSGRSSLTQTASTTRPKFDQALVAYLKAYYDNKFYDRMGTLISKPQLPDSSNLLASLSNFSVPDSEITAAESVMLEFLVDTVDPTPVLGNTQCPIPTTTANPTCQPASGDPSTTTYYPGNSSNQPTALTVGLAKYVEIPAQGCGFTTKNVWVLQTLANGASDEAGTVSGLVANTAGGLGVSLGVFGKISIGDNATLSDLVKTGASELGLRTTLLASYFSLYHLNFTPYEAPALAALVPTPKSLTFAYKLGAPTSGQDAAQLSQTIKIDNPSGTLTWAGTSNQSWLSISPTQQPTAPGTASVTVDPTGLKAQTYTGTITLTPQGSTASPLSIGVTFTVSKD